MLEEREYSEMYNRDFNVYFNGKKLPSFVKVKGVGFSVLPAVNHTFRQIQGGGNLVTANLNLGAKLFNIDILIIKDQHKSLTEMCRELSAWCVGDSFKLSSLIFSDDPTVSYKGVVSNNVEINDIIFAGEGSIQITVPNGIATSTTPMNVESKDGVATLWYKGTAPSFPTITFHPTADRYNESIAFTNLQTGTQTVLKGDFLTGCPVTIDCSKKVVKTGDSIALKMLGLESEWIKFMADTTYDIKCSSKHGTFTVSYKENYF